MGVYDTSSVQTSNGIQPSSAQVYSTSLNLVAGATQKIDLKSLANLHRINNIQGIFIDNSAGTSAFEISTAAGQNLIIPNTWQGSFPLYLSADNVITVSGAGTVNITLLNFPTPSAAWPTTTQTLPISNNMVQVQDVALENLIQSGGFMVNDGVLGNADLRQSCRGGNVFSGTATAASTTTIITGAPSCFVSMIDVRLTNNATIAAAGVLTVSLAFQNAGTIFARSLSLLAATAYGDFNFFGMSGLNLIGNLASDNLTLTLNTALTNGQVEYSIIGGTTATA